MTKKSNKNFLLTYFTYLPLTLSLLCIISAEIIRSTHDKNLCTAYHILITVASFFVFLGMGIYLFFVRHGHHSLLEKILYIVFSLFMIVIIFIPTITDCKQY